MASFASLIAPSMLCLLALILFAPVKGSAQSLAASARSVHGKVLTPSGSPQANAVVYLENEKSQTVKTYITTGNGEYRFVQLNPDVNYRVWAKYGKMESKSRTISSFESRHDFQFDLKLRPKK